MSSSFQADPAFELEKQRHEAVLAFQKAVIEKQQRIAAQNDASAQRQAFANNRQQQGARRPVFNAANFNPSRPASEQKSRALHEHASFCGAC